MTSIDDHTERIAALEKRLAIYDDREAIRQVLYRYARGADRADLELFKSCYWPDATDVHWFFNGNAHEFADYVIPLLARIPNSQHSITNPIIDLDGDRAFTECQWYVVHHVPLDETTDAYVDQQMEGRYIDIFERRDGQWRILHRQVVLESARELLAHPIMPLPADHPALGQRAPRDVVYLGMNLLNVPIVPVAGLDLWADVQARHAVEQTR